MAVPSPPVLIAGGGIAGLGLALALARRGIKSRILERSPTFSEAGAGIQIGPNGMRILAMLGVDKRLEAVAGRPAAIHVQDARNARLIATLPLGGWIEQRHGAPYWVALRADLQAALLSRVREESAIEVSTGFEVVDVTEEADTIVARAATGASEAGRLLVGADGLWSRMRERVAPATSLVFSGRTAARAVIPASAAPRQIDTASTCVWLAPGAHVVHYPVRAGEQIAIVVVVEERFERHEWDSPAGPPQLKPALAEFDRTLIDFMNAAPGWRKWGLFTTGPLATWHAGRLVLVGDAAHPVLPFLAQGGVLALEDAAVLAAALDANPDDCLAAFAGYESRRRERVAQVQAASQRNGRIYHLSGTLALARDAALRLTSGGRVMAGYDWLYGWQPDSVGS